MEYCDFDSEHSPCPDFDGKLIFPIHGATMRFLERRMKQIIDAFNTIKFIRFTFNPYFDMVMLAAVFIGLPVFNSAVFILDNFMLN